METIYLSGYTREDNKGIHTLELDENGKFGRQTLIIEEANPTYIVLSNDHKHLYTLSEKNGRPGVAHYYKKGEKFVEVGRASFLNNTGCYLSLDEKRQVLYVANYHEGNLAVVKIEDDGALTLKSMVSHEGNGPHPNQDKAHAHFIHLTPDNNYVLSCDLGTDEVTSYTIDDAYNLIPVSTYYTEAGSGPRHLTFHPEFPIVYIINELTYTIDITAYSEGTLTFIDRIPSLEDIDTENSSAAIRVSSDGRFLYVSNRGYNTISVFAIEDEGKHLSPIQCLSTEANFPRDFNFNHSEDYIIVGHQKESKITLFHRNQETGLLTLCNDSISIPEIVCVVHE